MQPVASSMVNLRNLSGLRSLVVMMPTVSAREMGVGVPLREKVVGSEGIGVRERKSKARSLTCVLLRFSMDNQREVRERLDWRQIF